MAKQTERSTYECPATPEELLDEMQDPSGKYKHLQIILTRNSINRSMGLGQQYLVVNNNGFGVYQLLNTDYCNGVIQLKLKDTYTGEIAHITLNITDKHPDFINRSLAIFNNGDFFIGQVIKFVNHFVNLTF